MPDQILALSVRQPWATAIVEGKDLENRARVHSHRGPLLIHASAGLTHEEVAEFIAFVAARGLTGSWNHFSPRDLFHQLPRGGIVGVVDMIDAVEESDSPWWMGPKAFVLRNPRALPFIPCKGTVAPLLWRPDAEVSATVAAALAAEPR